MHNNMIRVLFVAMLAAASCAHAAMRGMPEIPTVLPDAVRQPLLAKRQPLAEKKLSLIAEADRNKSMCANVVVDSAQHSTCLGMQRDFNARVAAMNDAFDQLADEIDAAITAEIKRLAERDAELTRNIASDITAVNRLGFARRAEDFEEWNKLAAGARDNLSNEVQGAIVDALVSKIQDSALERFQGFDPKLAGGWIASLEKLNPPPKELIAAIRRVLSPGTRTQLVDDAKFIVEHLDALKDIYDADNIALAIALTYHQVVCDMAKPPLDTICQLGKTEAKLVAASLVNFGTQHVAKREIERLTQMTEEQLNALKKINGLLVKHVNERNEVRAAIKALEQS